MKAIGLSHTEGALVDLDLELPAPSGRDLLVKVNAVSVNPLDVKMSAAKSKVKNKPRILGWDAAGVVVQTAPDCSLFKPGDPVYYAGSIVRPGCNSERRYD